MADVLDEFQFQGRRRVGGPALATYCDGRVWRLVRGDDFTGYVNGMRNRLYVTAARMGKKMRTTIVKDGEVTALVVQAYVPEAK